MSRRAFFICKLSDGQTNVMTDTTINWISFHLEDYYIKQNRFKLYISFDSKDVPMVTSLTEDNCRYATENIFLPVRHGTYQLPVRAVNSGVVGGKL